MAYYYSLMLPFFFCELFHWLSTVCSCKSASSSILLMSVASVLFMAIINNHCGKRRPPFLSLSSMRRCLQFVINAKAHSKASAVHFNCCWSYIKIGWGYVILIKRDEKDMWRAGPSFNGWMVVLCIIIWRCSRPTCLSFLCLVWRGHCSALLDYSSSLGISLRHVVQTLIKPHRDSQWRHTHHFVLSLSICCN